MKLENILGLIVVAVIGFASSGCLVTRSEMSSQEQTKTNNQKMADNQKEQAEQKPDPDEVMRQLIGRVEVLETQLNQMKSEKAQAALTPANPSVDAVKFQAMQEAMIKLEDKMQKIDAEKQAIAAAIAAKAHAEEELKTQSKLSPFQVAEVHFKNKEWKKAILSYQKYSEENPKGKMVAESKYKIGVSFQELGLKDEAIAFYEEVVAQFPATEIGKKAKFRLTQVKKK